MNASKLPPPSRLRSSHPLVRSLLVAGLLSAHGAWAGTWNINFTPEQTAGTPSEPVFSWTPPSGTLLGGLMNCFNGTISPSSGVHVLPSSSNRQAFVEFTNAYASPSSVAVTVTPDTPAGADCDLNATPYSYDPTAPSTGPVPATNTIHDGYVRYIPADYDSVTDSYGLAIPMPLIETFSVKFHEAPDNFPFVPTFQVNIAEGAAITTNLFMVGKTTAATVEFELTTPQLTDSTITFTVQETPQTYQTPGGPTAYDPVTSGYQPTYGTPTTLTVTIPAGSTSVSVTVPNILPGSLVTLTPLTHPGDVVGSPTLVQTSPLVVMPSSGGALTYLATSPDAPAGPFTDTPTNVIDFKVVLDVAAVTPPTPTAVPTLGTWALGLLGTLLAGFAAFRRRSINGHH